MQAGHVVQTVGVPHAGVLAAIHAAAFPAADAWSQAAIATQLSLPGVAGFVHPLGGMALVRVVAGESELLTLAVAADVRRRGVGADLLCAAMHHAALHGAATMFLEVASGNAAARALYARAGWQPVGLRRRYYADGADACVLRACLMAPVAGEER